MHKKYFKISLWILFLFSVTIAFLFPRSEITSNLLNGFSDSFVTRTNQIATVYLTLFVCFFFVQKIRKHFYKRKLLHCTIDDVDSLSGLDFEYFLYFQFKKRHIRVTITPYTHDFGADLIVHTFHKKIVVQAKRWNDNVGIKAVQETLGAMSYYKATHGVVITSSYFTTSAMQLAAASDVVLINRYDLIELIKLDKNEMIHKLLSMDTDTFDDSTNDVCPQCGSHLCKRKGKYGEFLGCSNYPRCSYARKIS